MSLPVKLGVRAHVRHSFSNSRRVDSACALDCERDSVRAPLGPASPQILAPKAEVPFGSDPGLVERSRVDARDDPYIGVVGTQQMVTPRSAQIGKRASRRHGVVQRRVDRQPVVATS